MGSVSTEIGELSGLRRQHEAAAARYESGAHLREEIERRREVEGTRVVDTPDQVEARVQRLATSGLLPPERLIAALPGEQQVERHIVLERIIAATNDLQAVHFLPRGARAARTIARVSMQRNGRAVPFGTGFLVSPRLLLTNNHVLPDAGTARECVAEFNCEIDLDMASATIVSYPIEPDRLFLTDEHLDFSLVAVGNGPDGRSPGEEFGWNPLIAQQGKIVTGEPVNVIGHPMGRLKEIAIRDNTLQNQLDDFLHYTTDTEPGNSGSPVFNDQWEVVSLHHSGVPKTDADGNWLKKDGTPWRPGEDEALVEWVANEGVRVSVLLRHIHEQNLTEDQRGLLDEMGPQARPVALAPMPNTAPRTTAIAARPEAAARAPGKHGVTPSARAYGGDVELVFLHGRSQQGFDPEVLRRRWTAGLVEGLTLAALGPLRDKEAWFPFYGDAFAAALARESAPIGALDPANVAEAMAPAEPSSRSVYEELLGEAAERSGLTPELARTEDEGLPWIVDRLQKQLSWVAGHSGLDELLIAAIFKDVAAYLDREKMRDLVLDTVMETMPASGQVVLVSHSLGTVVAMDLLTRLPREVEVVQLVTAGSPLGMDGVFKRLRSAEPHKPERVLEWVNAWCSADAVAIGCPLRDSWGPDITEVITNNPKDRAHSIAEYLADPRVARAIGSALGASSA